MSRPLIIFGCGGHGREIAELVSAVNSVRTTWELIGLCDDSPSAADVDRLLRRGWPSLTAEAVGKLPTGTAFVVGIGSGRIRRLVDARLREWGHQPVTLVHPDATVGQGVNLGEGSVVFAGARLTTNITTGRHVHLNQNVTVGHDCILESFVTVNPAACISGAVHLEEDSMIGANASVLQGLRVGRQSVVGAGAVVVRDIASNVTVKGVPAR